jgi:hypothetical protein
MISQSCYSERKRWDSAGGWCDDTLLPTSLFLLDDTRLHVNIRVGLRRMFWYMFSLDLVCSHTCISYLVRMAAVLVAHSFRLVDSLLCLLRVIVLSRVWYLLARLLAPNTPWAVPAPVAQHIGHANMIMSTLTTANAFE